VSRQQVWNFDFTGRIESVDLQRGKYLLEAWGAQGRDGPDGFGGRGGYASGILTVTSVLFICVGGRPSASNIGGYNGGGLVTTGSGASGGGASHISLVSGLLSVQAVRNAILLAAGAGGGGRNSTRPNSDGGPAGGLEGFHPNHAQGNLGQHGGTQTQGGTTAGSGTSGSPGQGGNATAGNRAAGGAGWFGGAGGDSRVTGTSTGGGGGSSFLASFLEEAITISGNQSMPNPRGSGNIIGNPGHGFVRITALQSYEMFIAEVDGILRTYNEESGLWLPVN